MNGKISILVITLLAISTVGLGQDYYHSEEELYPWEEPVDIDEYLEEQPHCYQEEGSWYCYRLSVITNVPIEFKEDVECGMREDILENYQEKANCYSVVKLTEDITFNASLNKILSHEEYEQVRKEKTIGKEEVNVVLSPNAIDFEKCSDPEIEQEFEDGTNIYGLNCEYENQEYLANISYFGGGIESPEEDIIIYEMAAPKEEPLRIPMPSLPVLILIILIIGIGTWAFYPKIKQKTQK